MTRAQEIEIVPMELDDDEPMAGVYVCCRLADMPEALEAIRRALDGFADIEILDGD